MHRSSSFLAASALLLLAACAPSDRVPGASAVTDPSSRAVTEPGVVRLFGAPQSLGNGVVRTYIDMDAKDGRTPREIGVSISEAAMASLPAAAAPQEDHSSMSPHQMGTVYILDLPGGNPTPYKFVQFDWNPNGHHPLAIYGAPHFDFHFYNVPLSVRNSIVASDPQYFQKAANLPAPQLRMPWYIDAGTALQAPQGAVAMERMGLHWLDIRSPELQLATGHPELWKPFDKTFFYGSWDGQFIFDEPMITKAYITAKRDDPNAVRDEVVAIPSPNKRAVPGFYPSAYRITYDAVDKEFRVALTQLGWRE